MSRLQGLVSVDTMSAWKAGVALLPKLAARGVTVSSRSAAGQATGPVAAAFCLGLAWAARPDADADGEADGVAVGAADGVVAGDALGAELTGAGDVGVVAGVL
jgi:hypothetical protein